MKKLTISLLTLLLTISLTSCTTNKQKQSTTSTNEGISVDASLLDVTITLPATYFSSVANETAQDYVESLDKETKSNIKSLQTNEDGSLTITMSKSKYEEMMSKTKQQILSSINDIVSDNETYPNITNIETNDTFTKYTITLASKEMDLMDTFTALTLYLTSYMYQSFMINPNYTVQITYVTEDGTVIEDNTYDEDTLNELSNSLSEEDN